MDKPQCNVEISEQIVDATPIQDDHLDGIIVRIGQLGPFQIFNFAWLCVPIIFSSWSSISYIFTAHQVDHRCFISACDNENSSFSEAWLNFSTPSRQGAWNECEQYAPSGEECDAQSFNRSMTIGCNAGYKVKNVEETIASEFSIFCSEEWQLYMVGTVSYIGKFLGMAVGGYFSDRYGRKVLLVVAGVLSSLAGLARSHSLGYYSFLFFEFLDMVVGSTLLYTALLMSVELVRSKHRVVAGMLVYTITGVAHIALDYLASCVENWRVLLRVIYTPALLHLLFICHVPESVRWLLSQSKELEAVEILRRAALVNRQALSEKELSELVRHNRKVLAQTDSGASQYTVRQICKGLGKRIGKCFLLWLANSFIDVSLSWNSTELGSNKFNNHSMMGLMQLPGIILAMLLMQPIGRRWTLALCLNSCSVLLLSMVVLDSVFSTAALFLYVLAKMACTCGIMVLSFFTVEMFPTSCRNSMLCICIMVGNIVAMLVAPPQTPLLISHYKYATHLLCATVGILSSLLSFGLPETACKPLPTTMEEARALATNNGLTKKSKF